MTGFIVFAGLLLLGAAVWAGFYWWSQRGQRKITKAADEGWEEAGKRH